MLLAGTQIVLRRTVNSAGRARRPLCSPRFCRCLPPALPAASHACRCLPPAQLAFSKAAQGSVWMGQPRLVSRPCILPLTSWVAAVAHIGEVCCKRITSSLAIIAQCRSHMTWLWAWSWAGGAARARAAESTWCRTLLASRSKPDDAVLSPRQALPQHHLEARVPAIAAAKVTNHQSMQHTESAPHILIFSHGAHTQHARSWRTHMHTTQTKATTFKKSCPHGAYVGVP